MCLKRDRDSDSVPTHVASRFAKVKLRRSLDGFCAPRRYAPIGPYAFIWQRKRIIIPRPYSYEEVLSRIYFGHLPAERVAADQEALRYPRVHTIAVPLRHASLYTCLRVSGFYSVLSLGCRFATKMVNRIPCRDLMTVVSMGGVPCLVGLQGTGSNVSPCPLSLYGPALSDSLRAHC